MDKQIRKIDCLVKKYLSESKFYIGKHWGKPTASSDNDIWIYKQYRWGIFKDDIAFIFKDNKVVDIIITESFLWIEMNNIFYFKGQNPEYKVSKLNKKSI